MYCCSRIPTLQRTLLSRHSGKSAWCWEVDVHVGIGGVEICVSQKEGG
jgi:hypothetical protein